MTDDSTTLDFWQARIAGLPPGAPLRDAIAVEFDWDAANRRTRWLLRRLVKGGSVLDVGCGVGDLFDHVLAPYHGVDVVPEFVAEAQKRYGDWFFSVADARDLSRFYRDSYRFVVSRGVPAGFLKSPEVLPSLLRIAQRVLILSADATQLEIVER